MPFKDGYQATKEIRKLFLAKGVSRNLQPKIVAVTGHVENEYVHKAYGAGMDKVYSKPIQLKDFAKLLYTMKLIEKIPDYLNLDSD
jgi:CheY-like chemotaxis protein